MVKTQFNPYTLSISRNQKFKTPVQPVQPVQTLDFAKSNVQNTRATLYNLMDFVMCLIES